MPPKPFYDIDPKIYLFKMSETPEERVRQWAIFELLSTYGYNINDIQVEVSCKIGSKYFPADIVIYKDRVPLIVVECKRTENGNQEEALTQARSYANFLKASLVVYTNGKSWIVERAVQGNWSSVVDIPTQASIELNNSIASVLEFMEHLKPILYWIYDVVPRENAYNFLSSFRYFVETEIDSYKVGAHLKVRSGLLGTLRYLLCVLGTGGSENAASLDKDPYTMAKMKETTECFENYLEETGYKLILKHKSFEGYRFNELYGMISSNLNNLVKNQRGLFGNEILVLRLIRALADYLWEVYDAKSYVDISSIVMSEIRLFVNETSNLILGTGLPDSLDKESREVIQAHTIDFWKQ